MGTRTALRIGLISDTHIPEAREELWPQVFEAFQGVDCILHAGDIHDIGLIDQLGTLAPIYAARGNGDDGSSGREVQPDDPRLREAWLLEFEGWRIGMTHTAPVPEIGPHITIRSTRERLFGGAELDVLVFGDTHVEWIETVGGVLCVNPGSPTFPRNYSTRLGTIGFLDLAPGVPPEPTIWQLTEHGIEPFDWSQWKRPF